MLYLGTVAEPHSPTSPLHVGGSSTWNFLAGTRGRCDRTGIEPGTVPVSVWDVGQIHPWESVLPARDGLGWVFVPSSPAVELFLGWRRRNQEISVGN